MSGLKESEVNLGDELARVTLARSQALETADSGRALVAELSAAIRGREDAALFQGLFGRLHATLACRAEDLDTRCDQLLSSWSLQPADVQRAADDCREAKEKMAALRLEVRAVHAGLGLEAELQAFSAGLQALASRLARWDAREVDSLNQRCQDTGARLDASIHAGRDPRPHRSAVKSLREDLGRLCESVRRREDQDEARNTVIAAIGEACRRLAFTAHHEPQVDPNAPRRFQINTGAFGILNFELSLDAVLRSDTDVVQPRACEQWVGEFEKQMARLGVGVKFHYPATGKPVRSTRSARGMGSYRPARQQSGGGEPC